MKRCVLLSVLLLLLIGPIAAQEESNEGKSWCVSVWYPSSEIASGYDSIINNADVIDTVNPFWYVALPDGTLHKTADAEDEEKLSDWRDAGFIIMPAIFSNGWMMIDSAEDRTHHVQQIVELVERLDYDGIDVDYEGFDPATREDFSSFVDSLATSLHSRGRLLSIAVHAKTSDEGSWGGAAAQDWQQLAASVDVFRIMTYDYTSRNEPPGPIAPPNWIIDVLAYAQSVTDLSRVRLGLNFYGYSWQRGTPPSVPVTWQSYNRWVDAFDLEVIRDEDMEAQIDFKATGLPRQTVYMADAAGLSFKLELIRQSYPELGGVAIWGLGDEDPENWDVLREQTTDNCDVNLMSKSGQR